MAITLVGLAHPNQALSEADPLASSISDKIYGTSRSLRLGSMMDERDLDQDVKRACTEYQGCEECTGAGCFWQTQAGCNTDCLIMDTACYGKTDDWKAFCPLPGRDPRGTTNPYEDLSNTASAGETFVDDDTDCCDEQPRCPIGLEPSTTNPCTQKEFKTDMCIIERHCCNQIFCRASETYKAEPEVESTSYSYQLLGICGILVAGFVISSSRAKK